MSGAQQEKLAWDRCTEEVICARRDGEHETEQADRCGGGGLQSLLAPFLSEIRSKVTS